MLSNFETSRREKPAPSSRIVVESMMVIQLHHGGYWLENGEGEGMEISHPKTIRDLETALRKFFNQNF